MYSEFFIKLFIILKNHTHTHTHNILITLDYILYFSNITMYVQNDTVQSAVKHSWRTSVGEQRGYSVRSHSLSVLQCSSYLHDSSRFPTRPRVIAQSLQDVLCVCRSSGLIHLNVMTASIRSVKLLQIPLWINGSLSIEFSWLSAACFTSWSVRIKNRQTHTSLQLIHL